LSTPSGGQVLADPWRATAGSGRPRHIVGGWPEFIY